MLASMVVAVAGLLVLGQSTGFAGIGCIRLDKDVRGIHIIHGRFASSKPIVTYCIYALAGQHALINIKPSDNLDTQGYLRFVGTPRSGGWAPGSPGGVVFNEALPWTGKYLLVQRFQNINRLRLIFHLGRNLV
jgi:hypothetical protein